MLKMNVYILFFFIFFTNLYAIDKNETIDTILSDIEKKTDLSEKTKLENSGISFIYTRNDLERMQAKNLKDILKTMYPFGYNENRYGFADPLTSSTDHPFRSSKIRIFIDNQELTSGYSGSGIFIVGDMDIDFVDHIEVYSVNPTYEYSTEPTFILIKLYSKIAQKDKGGKIRVSASSHNSSSISGYYADELDEWSYFTYASYNKENKDKYRLDRYSKDRKYVNAFVSIYNDTNKIIIQALHQDRDAFISQKFDLPVNDCYFNSDYLHLGYDGSIENFSFIVSYDYFSLRQNYSSPSTPTLDVLNVPYSVNLNSNSNVLSLESKYKYIINDDRILFGVKYRYKDYKFVDSFVNGVEHSSDKLVHQTFSTVFLENQYDILDNLIFTAGVNYSMVKESERGDVDNLFLYRLGFTYLTSLGITSKTIFSHTNTLVDLMYDGNLHYVEDPNKMTYAEANIFLEELTYKINQHKFEILFSYRKTRNAFLIDEQGKLYNSPDIINSRGISIRDTFRYNDNDKLFFEFSYRKQTHFSELDELIDKRVIIRNLNTYKRFDIFNELIYSKDSKKNKNFYDYSAGVIYHYSDDLSFSIKGQNIFNKAKTTDFILIDPNTLEKATILDVPSIEQRFMLSMEYLF